MNIVAIDITWNYKNEIIKSDNFVFLNTTEEIVKYINKRDKSYKKIIQRFFKHLSIEVKLIKKKTLIDFLLNNGALITTTNKDKDTIVSSIIIDTEFDLAKHRISTSDIEIYYKIKEQYIKFIREQKIDEICT